MNAETVLAPLFGLACLFIGAGLGVVLTKLGYFIVFREHLDKHFFASTPDRDCPFCREERGSFVKGVATMSAAAKPIRINHESASWENMSMESRKAVARAAGYTNEFQLIRIGNSGWALLAQSEQTAIFRALTGAAVISAQVSK